MNQLKPARADSVDSRGWASEPCSLLRSLSPASPISRPRSARPSFFRVGVEILLVLYTALVFLDSRFLPPRSPLLWSVVAYLALLLVATIVSLDRSRSWWGTLDRMEGAFAILHYGAFFIMLASLLRTQKDWVVFFTSLWP